MKKALTILFVSFLVLAYQGFAELQAQSSDSRSSSRSSVRSSGIATSYSDGDVLYSSWSHQDEGSSQLSLSKMFDQETVSKEGNFTVEKNYNMLKIAIEGTVKEGNLNIALKKPDGSEFNNLTIDNSADVRWTKVFSEYKEEYVGKWTYEIKANAATGRYNLSITTH
ncbi:MAG: hypothetical protein ISS19_12665 [Bacteroidales bacterium]|nr:hypothetical protein [Bacteroidales bacterium]